MSSARPVTSSIRTVEELESVVFDRLDATLSFTPDAVEVVGAGGIERTETGKVKRVYDHR